jgi:hypothetical protein
VDKVRRSPGPIRMLKSGVARPPVDIGQFDDRRPKYWSTGG